MQGLELVLQLVELVLRELRTLPGLRQRAGQSLDLLRGGTGGGPQRLDLAGEPGQPLPPVGDGADRGQVGALGVGERLLQLGPPVHRGGQHRPGLLRHRVQLGLVGLRGVSLALQLVGIPARAMHLGGRGEVAGSLSGQLHRATQPLGQRGELVPGVLGRAQAWRGGGQLLLQPGLLGAGPLQRAVHLIPASSGGRLVGLVLGDRRPQRHQVIGVQPQPGIAQISLHGLRAPGDLGLLTQRLELAA